VGNRKADRTRGATNDRDDWIEVTLKTGSGRRGLAFRSLLTAERSSFRCTNPSSFRSAVVGISRSGSTNPDFILKAERHSESGDVIPEAELVIQDPCEMVRGTA